jgi:UDP-N-acetylglucosamine--N-acetylmuramyl-(pentapeptide) pyrophosphoryl-undecaprenol N-acetylglucosamine transferase
MRVLIAAGGTGGHIFPALALARHLQGEKNNEILFVGTEKGMEAELVPAAGFMLRTIPVAGLERRLSPRLGRALFMAAGGVLAARGIMRRFRPDVVMGTGGYVSGPVVLAAVASRLPAVIHEQNAVPGFTNAILARWVNRVCVSLPGSERRFPRGSNLVLTGNPRATEAVNAALSDEIAPVELRRGLPVLLCVGGSHGAARLNEAFSGGLAQVLSALDIQVVYITGKRYYDELAEKLDRLKLRFPQRLHCLPFHPFLPALLARSSLVISRAGATTLAEITALGVPSILVPSPNVTNNHQEHNARYLSDNGAAELVLETELDSRLLAELITGLLGSKERLAGMSAAAKSLGFPDAAERLAGVLREAARNRSKK